MLQEHLVRECQSNQLYESLLRFDLEKTKFVGQGRILHETNLIIQQLVNFNAKYEVLEDRFMKSLLFPSKS